MTSAEAARRKDDRAMVRARRWVESLMDMAEHLFGDTCDVQNDETARMFVKYEPICPKASHGGTKDWRKVHHKVRSTIVSPHPFDRVHWLVHIHPAVSHVYVYILYISVFPALSPSHVYI